MATQSRPATFVALAAALLMVGCTTPPAPSSPLAEDQLLSLSTALETAAASRGRAIALVGCASCHAIDAAGASPFVAAPPFRDVVRRRSLDDIETAMAQGLVTTHPAMPPYVFRASEIDDLVAYFGTLQSSATRAPEGS